MKAALDFDGIDAKSLAGHLLFEPWAVKTKDGGFYKVYSPFWRAAKEIGVGQAVSRPASLSAPEAWPTSDKLEDWNLGKAMHRGGPFACR